MSNYSIFLFLLIFLFSCQGGRPATPATGARVSDSDHLYFKNIKTRSYLAEEDDENYLTRYLHQDFLVDTNRLRLELVDNWIHSRAFLALKHVDSEEKNAAKIATFIQPDPGGHQSVFSPGDLNDAAALERFKNTLASGTRLCYLTNGGRREHCLAAGGKVRNAMRVTITDYLRLTQLDRQ